MVHKGDLLDDSEEDDLGPEYEKVVAVEIATALRDRVAELEEIRNPQYIDEKMHARFRSGNHIAVERAWVTAIEWDSWLTKLAAAERDAARYCLPCLWIVSDEHTTSGA